MDSITTTVQNQINTLTADTANRQSIIADQQNIINSNNATVTALTAQLNVLQTPNVQQAIIDANQNVTPSQNTPPTP